MRAGIPNDWVSRLACIWRPPISHSTLDGRVSLVGERHVEPVEVRDPVVGRLNVSLDLRLASRGGRRASGPSCGQPPGARIWDNQIHLDEAAGVSDARQEDDEWPQDDGEPHRRLAPEGLPFRPTGRHRVISRKRPRPGSATQTTGHRRPVTPRAPPVRWPA